jgi:hypothetical protein
LAADPAAAIRFREVWSCDTEFQAEVGEPPHVLCLVARELRTRREVRLWRDDLIRLAAAPFDVGPDALFVAFFASAELGCFLQLGWPLPCNVLDLFCEHRTATNGLQLTAGNSLLGVLSRHGLASMASAEKDAMRSLILRQQSWSEAEAGAILDYCAADTVQTEALLLRMADGLDWPRALWRGRYMAAVARMERVGVPVDLELYRHLAEHWGELKAGLVEAVDAAFGVYDGTAFREDRFAALLARHGVPWPRHPSGRLVLDKQTFSDQARTYPDFLQLHELRKTLAMMRLTDLAIGSDARNRCLLSPFRSVTGRNQPSNSRFVFGTAKWLRGLVRPPEGHGLAYLDWSGQEFAIAAALSGDERMIEDYAAGDPHMGFARAARLAPADATKATHPLIREKCKTVNLGVLFGMSAYGLAARLGVTVIDAEELLRMHRGAYRRFWTWSEATVTTALLRREIATAFGWRMQVTGETRPRTLMNWPMQSYGAEAMRGAAIAATESGIEVAAPVHDAFIILSPLDRLEADAEAMKAIMERAGSCVTGGLPIRVDDQLIRFPLRYGDDDPPKMWPIALDLLANSRGYTG